MNRCLRRLAITILCCGSAGFALPADGASRPETGGPGVIVESIAAGSALEGTDLHPGDLLLDWERLPDPPIHSEGGKGEIRTVFDWSWVRIEQAPRGTVQLHGERDGEAILIEVPRGRPWDAQVRPRMAVDLLQTFTEGRQRIAAGNLEEGIGLWNELVRRVEPETAPDLRSWLLLRIGEAWSNGGRRDKAQEAMQAALAEAGDAQTRVAVLEALGESSVLATEMTAAEALFRQALEAGETAWGESLQVAATLTRLGSVLRRQNRLDDAARVQARALEIRQRWAPESLEVANSLIHLNNLAWARGDLEEMTDLTRRALAIQERWAPDSQAVANSLNDLAVPAIQTGRFAEATDALRRALAILERKAPDSLLMATSLAHLGEVARARGDVETSTELHQRALAIREKLAPQSLATATSMYNLGALAQDRGDLATAAELYRRTLTVWEKAAPNGLGVAGNLDALGTVALERGDLDEAWSLLRRSLEIRERLAPGGHDVSESLSHLGMVAEARGDLSLALDFYRRAEEIHQSLEPGSIDEARTLQRLGRLYGRMRRPDQAAQLLAQAVDALESQMGRLGGSQDQQATFRARHEEIYRDAIEIELDRGHTAEAFHLVERSRARSLLILLSERDLDLSGELPAALVRALRDNAARYDQTLRELSRWTPKAGDEARDALHRELSRLRRERDEIAAEIRKASPRLAALRQPQPLDLAAARKVLDPGTLALSYSVGKDRTALFAVTREGGLRVEILPLGEERLRRDVERFLEGVRQPAPASGPEAPDSPAGLARSLYRALIAPVADLVERSERVLILPDGPLHRLPFGALIRDTGGPAAAGGRYLTEWKPLHTALSLTVYGALRGSREPSRSAAGLVAFADPRYPKDLAPREEARDPVRRALGLETRSFNWAPLPYSRREAERIAEAYPESRLYLGPEATEEKAKTVARGARILHFATHGHLDDRTPLDSALVLTIPEELRPDHDNGLLQVWEIFESVRTDADLVVLSACDSALGRELSGEGLIGLTRAFQYAGARSVVASLWSVADQVTADLMARFHRHYAAGLTKDEALRQAQIELIREPVRITTATGQKVETDASAPFFWAAFQLFGDWR